MADESAAPPQDLPQTIFRQLDEALERAFRDNTREAVDAAILEIRKPACARLIEQTDPDDAYPDQGTPLFKAVRDVIVGNRLTKTNWRQFSNTLEAVLGALRDSWLPEIQWRAANYIGPTVLVDDGPWAIPRQRTETIRDLIMRSEPYCEIEDCRVRFDKLFREFNLLTREEVIQERLKSGPPRAIIPFT